MIINQNIQEILKSAKKLWNSTPKELPQLLLLNLFAKFLTKKKFNEHFNLCKAETSLDEIIKSINSETNNKTPGNDGLTIEFYRHFSNELAPVLLGGYGPLSKLDTMRVTYRTGIISAIRNVSRTNYFWKMDVRPKWERPK